MEIADQPVEAALRAVDCGDDGARRGELRRLAAGGGAEIDQALAGDLAEQMGGNRRGGVLHPPGTLGIARQGSDRAARGAAQRAGRQDLRLEQLGPALGIAAHGEVERRLLEMGGGDGAGARLAIGARPGLPEPVRRVEPRRVLHLGEGGALGAQPAQHGVEQALMREEAARLGEVDSGRHRGVGRGAQEQQLRDAEAQHVVHDGRPRRQRRIEAMGDQRIDLAETAQHRGDQQPGEGAVARRQRRHIDIVLDGVVERTLPSKDGTDQIDGHAAGRRIDRHTGPTNCFGAKPTAKSGARNCFVASGPNQTRGALSPSS